MQLNRYFPVVFIYFFLNSVALPFGLTYTTLLAPLLYFWILLVRKRELLLPFIAILAPYIVLQLVLLDVDHQSYFVSLLNLIMVYVFCQAVYTFVKVCKDPEKILRQILIANFIFCVIAVPVYFSVFYDVVWMEQNVSRGLKNFRRFKLFTYEPSYYALLFIPLFFYYLLQYFFRQNKISGGLLLVMIFLPLILSFSIGVITAAIVAGIVTWIIYFRKLTEKKRIFNAIVYTGVALFSGFIVLILFFRNNPFFIRMRNIFRGSDTSAKGRTTEAFLIAEKILDDANTWWGVGLGQIKMTGGDLIRKYYHYEPGMAVAIPNAAAETLAVFGWTGLILRLLIEISLFFFTRVWKNYYRLLLFVFIFLYQFTGSFITNAAEYVIWILAFTNVFRQFDVVDNSSEIKQQPLRQEE
ncbi:MAG TPA: hypothetical protein PKC72_16535 [Chitinophagaceae bacterium]|nr:hypothetical protein [Chitinophagaceae bacterium]